MKTSLIPLGRILSTRWRVASGIAVLLVALIFAGFIMLHQRQLSSSASVPAGACTPDAPVVGMLPPDVTLPVNIPAGEPRVVAMVNGEPLCAEGLELRTEGTLANNRKTLQRLQQMPPGAPPSSQPLGLLASLKETPNQVRHNALTQMIQERLLLQEGKRLGLTASVSAAQAMARQQLQLIDSLPASDPTRTSFESSLRASHLTEQTFVTNSHILQGYVQALTIAAMRQHILRQLPPGTFPTAGVNAYVQHLWQTGNVRVYLPAQLGW